MLIMSTLCDCSAHTLGRDDPVSVRRVRCESVRVSMGQHRSVDLLLGEAHCTHARCSHPTLNALNRSVRCRHTCRTIRLWKGSAGSCGTTGGAGCCGIGPGPSDRSASSGFLGCACPFASKPAVTAGHGLGLAGVVQSLFISGCHLLTPSDCHPECKHKPSNRRAAAGYIIGSAGMPCKHLQAD